MSMLEEQNKINKQQTTSSSTNTLLLSFGSAESAVALESIFYPGGTIINRLQASPDKVDSFQKFKETALKVKPVIPKSAASTVVDHAREIAKQTPSVSRIPKSVTTLFDGFKSSVIQKSFARPYKFITQQYFQKQTQAFLTQCNVDNDNKFIKTASSAGTAAVVGAGEVFGFHWFDTVNTKQRLGDPRSIYKIIREDKFNLYDGASAALWRNVLGSAIFFGSYDAVLRNAYDNPDNPTTKQKFVAAGSSGVINSLLTNPLDVIKVRLQKEHLTLKQGLISTAEHILKEEGVSAFGKGAWLKALQSFPKLALPMFVFQAGPQILDNAFTFFNGLIPQKLESHSEEQRPTCKA